MRPGFCAEMPLKPFGGYESPRIGGQGDSRALQRLCNGNLKPVKPAFVGGGAK